MSGLAEGLPDFLRFSIVVLLVTYLPGDVIAARALGLRFERLPLRLATAFATGLAVYSLITWLCWIAGFGFSACVNVLKVVTLLGWGGAAALQLMRRPGEPEVRKRPTGQAVVVLALAVGMFFAAAPLQPNHRGDGFDHIGYIRAIEREDALAPVGVLAPPVDAAFVMKSDPRKGTFHPLLAVTCQLSATDPVDAWRWLPAFLAPAAVMAFWVFATTLLPSGVYAPFALLLFVMFQGGLGRVFLGNLGYGQHLALVFHWLLVALCVSFARDPKGRLLALILAIAAGAAAVHIDALIHFGLLIMSLLLFARAFSLSWAAAGRLALGAAVVAAVMLGWKLAVSVGDANPLHTHPQGLLYLGEIGSRWFVPSPVELLKRYGLLFLVGLSLVPTLLLVRRHRSQALMCLGLALPPLLLAMNPFVAPIIYDKGTYLLHRFLLNVPVFATTALVLGSLIAWSREGRFARKAAAFVLVAMWARVFIVSAGAWSADLRRVQFGQQPAVGAALAGVARYLGDHADPGAVILSDPITSYALTAVTNQRAVSILHQHANPNDPLAVVRVAAARNAMSPYTLQSEMLETVRRFDVAYVVVNGSGRARAREFMAEWDPADASTLR